MPTIMLTSRTTPQDRARAKAVGVRMVLEKPLLENILMDNIRAVLGGVPGWASCSPASG
jgi:DNA-binding response OmpR family regulator